MRKPARPGAPPLLTVPLAVLAAAAMLVVGVLFALDEDVSRAMLDEPPGVRAFLGYATDVGLVHWYIYPALALLALFAVADRSAYSRIGRTRVANVTIDTAYIFASVAFAGIVTNVLKILFGRARPTLLDQSGSFAFELLQFADTYKSFPSGHSTTMGAITAVLGIWFPALRVPILVAGLCFALTRIVVRAHFPSDVAAGFAIGAVTAILFARWLARRYTVYRFVHAGIGWRGLVPQRRERSRRYERSLWREVRSGVRRPSLRRRRADAPGR